LIEFIRKRLSLFLLLLVLTIGCEKDQQKYDVEATNVNTGIRVKWNNVLLSELPPDLRYAVATMGLDDEAS